MTFTQLKNHRLSFQKSLKVDHVLFEKKFAAGCSMNNCNAACCADGVFVDLEEKARVLRHTAIVQKHMDPDQDHDPSRWFDGVREVDADFPSGHREGTVADSGKCVFLNSRGHCVLQKAAVEEGMPKFAIKPFFCVAYPLVIEEGVLTLDDPWVGGRTQCCTVVRNGTGRAVDICQEELVYMLGEEGAEEVRAVQGKT